MRIDSSCKFSQIIDTKKLKIVSQDGLKCAIINFDDQFIKTKRMRSADWSQIDVYLSGSTVSKAHFISMEKLQLAVDQEEKAQEAAIENAAYTGNTQGVRSILNQGTISDEIQGDAFMHAVSKGFTEIVALFLEKGSISEGFRAEALMDAVFNGRIQMAQVLLASGSISTECLEETFTSAVKARTVDIVRLFLELESESISGECLEEAFRSAVLQEDRDIVRLFLESGLIADREINAVLRYAVDERHYAQILAVLIRRYAAPPFFNKEGRLHVHPQDLTEYPEAYLASVARYGLNPVIFLMADGSEQPGVDAGGLTKAFLSDLCDHLIVKEVIELDSLRFPCSKKQNLLPYTQLGQLLSHIDQSNQTRTDSLYIGELFDPRTYGLLQVLAKPQNPLESSKARKQREFMAIAHAIAIPATQQSLVDFLNKQDPIAYDRAVIITALKKAGKKPSEITTILKLKEMCRECLGFKYPFVDFLNKQDPTLADKEAIIAKLKEVGEEPLEESTTADLREMCFECLGIRNYHASLFAILKGLGLALKAKIFAEGSSMAKQLQGQITERLLGKVVPSLEEEDEYSLEEEEKLVVLKKIVWLKEKIQAELADPCKTWIKRFLKCVTGQSVMPVKNIQIRASVDNYCHAHTCFNQLDVPIVYEVDSEEQTDEKRKEAFFARLEVTIDAEGFGEI